MIRVLIADDHAVVRKGLGQILAETNDMVVAGEAGEGRQVLAMVRRDRFDVIVLDIAMPGQNGLEVLRQLRKERPRLPVLILSMHPEDQYAIRVLKAGAAGYLTKESAPEELIQAIRQVARGKKYVSATLAEKLALDLVRDLDKPSHELLSDREYQVFLLLASGKTVSQAGKELCLSVKTISTYRARVLEKMKKRTNAELTRYAFAHKLIE